MTTPASTVRRRGPNGRFLRPAESGDAPSGAPEPTPVPTTGTPPPLELYLLRHADAGDSAAWPGVDGERPLSKKGRRQAKGVARLLKELGLRVDAVISSPLVRAAQTAKPVAKATGVDVVTDERLGYGFGEEDLAALVAELGPAVERVVLVGHDPGFTDVASLLTGAQVSMSKGALARIDLAERGVRSGSGVLRWLLPPDAVAR